MAPCAASIATPRLGVLFTGSSRLAASQLPPWRRRSRRPCSDFRFRSTSEPECRSTAGGPFPHTAGVAGRPDLATVRPLPSPEVKRLGLVRRMEVLRNG